MNILSLLSLAAGLVTAQAAVTVYGITGVVQQTVLAPGATSTPSPEPAAYVPPAFNTATLIPPPVPSPAPANQFNIQLLQNRADVNGLSIPQSGAFYGFSIEMSVATQVSKWRTLTDILLFRLTTSGLR